MSYTVAPELEEAYRPDFYFEEFFIPHLDFNGDVVATTWVARGYNDLTDFWADCEANTSACTFANYTPADWDGSFIAVTYYDSDATANAR